MIVNLYHLSTFSLHNSNGGANGHNASVCMRGSGRAVFATIHNAVIVVK